MMRWSGCARARGRWATRRGSGSALCYALALVGWGAAIWAVRPQPLALLALLPAALHLAWQAARTDPADGALALALVSLEPLHRPAAVRSASS